jgi:hypothetical protein
LDIVRENFNRKGAAVYAEGAEDFYPRNRLRRCDGPPLRFNRGATEPGTRH